MVVSSVTCNHNINISSDDYEILLFMLLLVLFFYINCYKIKLILEFQNFKQEFFKIIKCIKRNNYNLIAIFNL